MEFESNSTVTAILARCLVEPEFQRRLSGDTCGTLHDYDLSRELRSSFARFEFSKLELFGALITQTQHNFLWETFPCARALMKRYGIELSVFRAYRQHTEPRPAQPLSRQMKIEQFTTYLKEFLLGAKDKRYPGLLEILTHERCQWELQGMAAGQATKTDEVLRALPRRAREFDRMIPTLPSTVRLAEYRYNPLEIATALETKNFDPARLKRRRTRLFYRLDPAMCQLSVLEATPAVWRVFQKVDGKRSAGTIMRAAASRRPKRELRHYFEAAYEGGLIDLRCPR
jgi:hypothetical protein